MSDSGFSDSIVGGIGSLIRQYIQSPNYVPGVSGWAINKDGSAEFNNGTFRGGVIISGVGGELLVYSPTPGAGNLIFAVASASGADPYGNTFLAGVNLKVVTSFTDPGTLNWHLGELDFQAALMGVQRSGGASTWFIQGPQPLSTSGSPVIQLGDDGSVNIESVMPSLSASFKVRMGGPREGIQIGLGPTGQYYAQEAVPVFQVINNNTTTIVAGLTNVQTNSDYIIPPIPWNLTTGVWTCPVDSFYDLTGVMSYTAGVAGTHLYAAWRGGAVVGAGKIYVQTDYNAGGAFGAISCCGTRWITAGSTLHFEVLQASGANRTLNPADSALVIARRL